MVPYGRYALKAGATMGPDTVAKKALIWLARRSKRVGSHIALHNSEGKILAATRPWILRKAAHSVTIGGDRVTKKICEKTLKSFDHSVLQNNGNYVFSKLFGRQIGRKAEQTAFRVVVDAAGRVVTGYAVTAAQALTSVTAVVLFEEHIVRTIDGLNRINLDYLANHPPMEESLAEKIADFFISDLGNDKLNEGEGLMLAESQYETMMREQYISALQNLQGRSIAGEERTELIKQFAEGIAGAVAPYVEDEG